MSVNKYQLALEVLSDNVELTQHNINELQWANEVIIELIDKQTPMKPLYVGNMILCGRCNRNTIYRIIHNERLYRCDSECGQVVDWSDED